LANKRNSEKLFFNNTIRRFDTTSETVFPLPLTQVLSLEAVFIGNDFCLETGSVKPSAEHLYGAPRYRLSRGLKTSLVNTCGIFFPGEYKCLYT